MIPSIILEGRLMMSQEMDYCEDYFPVCRSLESDENEAQDDTGLIVGYQALLIL